jgi:hypothetical protein
MIPGIQEIQALALKYSKPQLANMAQSGLIDTQKAVLAAMMRDRIAKEDMKPPTTTVAQDVMGLQPPQMAQAAPQMGPQAEPQAPPTAIAPPQMGMPAEPAQEEPAQMAASGGLTSLPAGNVGNYAGGGIVAFAKGGTPYEIFTPDLKPTDVPVELTPEQAQINRQKLSTAFGINPDFYKERGAEVAGEREKLGKEKSTAWMDALIMGGLGAAAGKSPYALSNIAEGGIKGFETYRGEMKDIRERDKALMESENKIKEAEYLRSIGNMDAADKLIQESKKDKRTAEAANIALENARRTAEATAKTQAGETGFKEKSATGRTAMQVTSAEKIAGMPPAELKTLQGINAQEVAKATAAGLPPPTLLETYNAMQESKSKLMNIAANVAKFEHEWNEMPYLVKQKFLADNPKIQTSRQYVDDRMSQVIQYSGQVGRPIDNPADKAKADAAKDKAKADAARMAPVAPPKLAIDDLASNPTAERKRKFDILFGAGAADRALKNK